MTTTEVGARDARRSLLLAGPGGCGGWIAALAIVFAAGALAGNVSESVGTGLVLAAIAIGALVMIAPSIAALVFGIRAWRQTEGRARTMAGAGIAGAFLVPALGAAACVVIVSLVGVLGTAFAAAFIGLGVLGR